MNDIIEKYAEIDHIIWAKWHRYMVNQCILNEDGSLTIPKWAVDRWGKQAITPYDKLSEIEKNRNPFINIYLNKKKQIEWAERMERHGFKEITTEEMQMKIDSMSR